MNSFMVQSPDLHAIESGDRLWRINTEWSRHERLPATEGMGKIAPTGAGGLSHHRIIPARGNLRIGFPDPPCRFLNPVQYRRRMRSKWRCRTVPLLHHRQRFRQRIGISTLVGAGSETTSD